MIALEEESEQTDRGTAFQQRFHLQGVQAFQIALDRTLGMRDFSNPAITQAVDRRGPSRRQLNPALGLEFQEQPPAGHILEPTGVVAPVPEQAQFAREPRPIPGRMRLEPSPDQGRLLGADTRPLDVALKPFSLQQRPT